eukprot:2909877-Pyramimonas_sp.AAC.1
MVIRSTPPAEWLSPAHVSVADQVIPRVSNTPDRSQVTDSARPRVSAISFLQCHALALPGAPDTTNYSSSMYRGFMKFAVRWWRIFAPHVLAKSRSRVSYPRQCTPRNPTVRPLIERCRRPPVRRAYRHHSLC